jgi:leucine-zipper of insertion element IS481
MAQASDRRHVGDIREKAQAMLIYVLNSSLRRYEELGVAGLRDRSSRPRLSPKATTEEVPWVAKPEEARSGE